jgi:hypothetical protein
LTGRWRSRDPQRLAQGISSEQEALEIYYVSCAVIDIDHFMERSYLNALGEALAAAGCAGRHRTGYPVTKTGAKRLNPHVSLASLASFATLIDTSSFRRFAA